MKRANDWPDERRRFGRGVSGLLEDGWALSAPVFHMVGGIAAVASANHERLRERVEAFAAEDRFRNQLRPFSIDRVNWSSSPNPVVARGETEGLRRVVSESSKALFSVSVARLVAALWDEAQTSVG